MNSNPARWPDAVIQVAIVLIDYYLTKKEYVNAYQLHKYALNKSSKSLSYLNKIKASRIYGDVLKTLSKFGYVKQQNVKDSSEKYKYIPKNNILHLQNFLEILYEDSWKDVKWDFKLCRSKNRVINSTKFYQLKMEYSCKRIIKKHEDDLIFMCVTSINKQKDLLGNVEFIWRLLNFNNKLNSAHFDVMNVFVEDEICKKIYQKYDEDIEIRYKIPDKFKLNKYNKIKYKINTFIPKDRSRIFTVMPKNTINYAVTLDYYDTSINRVDPICNVDMNNVKISESKRTKKISVNIKDMILAKQGGVTFILNILNNNENI